jgi:hypothetical protein
LVRIVLKQRDFASFGRMGIARKVERAGETAGLPFSVHVHMMAGRRADLRPRWSRASFRSRMRETGAVQKGALMKTSDFTHTMEFTSPVGVVYAFFLVANEKEIPFYIGETGGFIARMGTYCAGSFGAATDFKVGAAVKYLLK